MNLGEATDNHNAVDRVKTRLQDDVGGLISLCQSNGFYPLWLLSRSLFPIAESVAALLYGNTTNNTAAQLSKFLQDDLGAIDPRYKGLSSTLCQIWRHGLTHHDEPPFLIVRPATTAPLAFDQSTRAVSWSLRFDDQAAHMTFVTYGNQNGQLVFSLVTFYDHLLAVLNDHAKWAAFPADAVMQRYDEWAVKVLDHNRPLTEPGRAAAEVDALLP